MGLFDFNALDPKSYEAMTLRQKIALAMMARKSAYPKTLGEGVASLGESFGDAITMGQLGRQAAEQRAYDTATGKSVLEDPDVKDSESSKPAIVPARPAPQATVMPPTPQADAARGVNPPPDPNARPLPVDQQQSYEPGAPTRMPSAAALNDWRSSVMGPQVVPPRPQPGAGPRSMAPSPTGAANIPPVAGLEPSASLAPPGAPPTPFAPTAAAQGAGDVISDAPPNEAARNNVATQLAQNVFPTVSNPFMATMPGGYKPPGATPPPPPPAVTVAPPDPRSAIRKAPEPGDYEPPDRPQPTPPTKPGPGPIELKYRGYETRDLGPQAKGAAKIVIEEEQRRLNAAYENQLKTHEIEKSNWLKEQEQRRDYLRHRPYETGRARGEVAKAGQEEQRLDQFPAQLTVEQKKREADLQKAVAEGATEETKNRFFQRTGREREPVLKELAAKRDEASKAAGLMANSNAAREALNSGFVLHGWGADAKFNLAQIGATLGIKDQAQIAAKSEQYRRASDATLSYGVMLIQQGDNRVTEGDLAQAKGLTGTLPQQLESKRKIIDAMQEDLRGRVGNYEDIREEYLRGDPMHRLYRVDTPPTAPPAVTKKLLEHRDNEAIRQRYDLDYGAGAAALELKRAKRREERARRAAEEDD